MTAFHLKTEDESSTIAGNRVDNSKSDLFEQISGMITHPVTFQRNRIQCRTLDEKFKKDHLMDHVVILNNETVYGLITRQHFYLQTGGPFGYELFQKKMADIICKRHPLIVKYTITITDLARYAMDRPYDDLYDPVLVVNNLGVFMGSVTMKQVIIKAVELEVRNALAANPLTNLPGNETIHHWIQEALSRPEYSIV